MTLYNTFLQPNSNGFQSNFIKSSHSVLMINPKHPLHCGDMASRSQQAEMTLETFNHFVPNLVKSLQISLGEKPKNDHNILRAKVKVTANSDDLEKHLSTT